MIEYIKKLFNFGYYNPNSPNYYKGFRYEKLEDGEEIWFDENNVCRK